MHLSNPLQFRIDYPLPSVYVKKAGNKFYGLVQLHSIKTTTDGDGNRLCNMLKENKQHVKNTEMQPPNTFSYSLLDF